MQTDFDVVIIGAGFSGIGAAYHLQKKCPDHKIIVLEARGAIGGTWDLFKYPGIRSDSDMYTLGFSFNPWKDPQAIADGPAILQYIKDTAEDFDLMKYIHFHHRLTAANWSSAENCWSLEMQDHPKLKYKSLKTRFLFVCSGYYNYEQGYQPAFKNRSLFEGIFVHPQHWDPQLDYTDKKVLVIGSGATAITLVPELAKKAEKVTMLQRSPSYIIKLPREDRVAKRLRRFFPARMAYQLTRWKNILISITFYNACRRWPDKMRKWIQKGIQKRLGDAYEHEHFNPKYNPWEQRLCMVPDSDLFRALKSGKAEIVTNHIKEFNKSGIILQDGQQLEADIIVSATGLQIQLLGAAKITVDGVLVDSGKLHSYKGVMFDGIPNLAFALGYTNASWTLKCDLNCHFVTKVLNYMKRKSFKTCMPQFDFKKLKSEPLLDFDAGYIQRAAAVLPKQGSKSPWKVHQNYIKDLRSLKYSKVNDKYLKYQK